MCLLLLKISFIAMISLIVYRIINDMGIRLYYDKHKSFFRQIFSGDLYSTL